jgi:AcrR family transcriptional regulator
MTEHALMARPRSEEKRSLLLDAAASVVAERGDSAPTALIAKAAGVAEGSLFTYFRSKEELLTELYGSLIAEVFSTIPPDLGARSGSREKLLAVWTNVLRWGLSNPKKWAAVRILGLSHLVDERRRRDGRRKGQQFLLDQLGVPDVPPGFHTRILSAFVDLTVDLTRQRPKLAEQYSSAGFEALWRAMTHG